MRQDSGQLSTLTGVRGFAALWVMLFHFSGSKAVMANLDTGPFLASGAWGVEVFFVLSGFVLSYVYFTALTQAARGEYKRYLLLRLARIYPLHLAIFLLYVFLVLLSNIAGGTINHSENFNVFDAAQHVFLVQAWGLGNATSWNPVAWSISVEWFAYLFVFPLTLVLGKRLHPLIFLSISMAAWLWFFCTLATDAHWEYLPLHEYGLLRGSLDFCIGAALYQLWNKGLINIRFGDALWLSAVTIIVAISFIRAQSAILLVPAIVVLIAGLGTGAPAATAVFSNRFSEYLGDISYSLYMIHPLVLVGSNLIYPSMPHADNPAWGCFFLGMQCLVAFVLSMISYSVIEKPSRAWLREKIMLPTRESLSGKRVKGMTPIAQENR